LGQVPIFDQPHYDELNRARESVVNVLAIDGREQNVQEAQRRNPTIRAVHYNAEDACLKTLGTFDLVFCFGLLYHLENPLLAIRNLEAITGKVFLAEGVIYPGETPTMGLVDEGHSDDQGLNHLAFYPTDACLQKMLYCAGFGFVYRLALMPQHPDYQGRLDAPRVRTILVASRAFIASPQLEWVREPPTALFPWDARSVAAKTSSSEDLRGLAGITFLQKLTALAHLVRKRIAPQRRARH
jgi:hypothetical protein